MEKVMLTSKVNANVVVDIPDLKFSRVWSKKGTKFPMDKEAFEQALYYPDFEYLINNGVLFVDDMNIKKELGIEPEDATEPENIIDLTDTLMTRMIGPMPESELAKIFEKLSSIQKNEVAEFAIEHSDILNMNKAKWIGQKTGKNINKAIELKEAAEEKTE